MAAPDLLGTKRTCPNCGARFYDLNHNPTTCPKCETTYDPTLNLRKRKVNKKAEEEDLLAAATALARAKSEAVEGDDTKAAALGGIGDDGVAGSDIEEMDDDEGLEALESIDGADDDEEEEGLDGENILDEIEEDDEDDDDDEDAN